MDKESRVAVIVFVIMGRGVGGGGIATAEDEGYPKLGGRE